MSGDNYFSNLARFLRHVDEDLASGAKLPAFLRPEQQEVTDAIRTRSQTLRDAVLRLDRESVTQSVEEAAAAGFYRASDEADLDQIPELDEARQELLKRLRERKENRRETDDSRDRPDDRH